MSKGFRKVMLLTLVVMMVLSSVSFAATTSKSTSAKKTTATTPKVDHKTTYTIDCFTMLGNQSGIQGGWFGKILKDKFNIKMNVISSNVEGGGDAKFATMMASGNLGDLVVFGSNTDGKMADAIKAGYLLDLTKNNLITKYGPYIVKNFPKVIQKSKITNGNGKALYGFGYNAVDPKNTGSCEVRDTTEETCLRFDLYKKIGAPKLNSWDDLLTALKKMQKINPKSDSGKPVYAFSPWKDWDGNMMMWVKAFTALMGYDEGDGFNDGGFIQFSPDGTSYGCLDTKGPYVKVLKMLNKANQMGLVDPDAITQTFDDMNNKLKDGQLLFTLFPWTCNSYNSVTRQDQGKGLYFVPVKGEKIVSYAFNPYGFERTISIGKKAKKPERLMELINWLYTPEGAQTYQTGPKGLAWNTDKNGKPYETDLGQAVFNNPDTTIPKKWGGGTWKDGMPTFNIQLVQYDSINPTTGEPYYQVDWSSTMKESATKLDNDWRAMYKTLTPVEYMKKNNMLVLKKPVFTGKAPEERPETLKQKQDAVKMVIRDASWKMVYAKNESEFNSLLKNAIDQANGLGYKDVLKWNLDHAKKVTDYLKTHK